MMFFLLLIVVALAMNIINASPAPSGCIVTTMIEKKVAAQRDTWRWLLVKQSVDPDTAKVPSQFVELQQLVN